MILQKMIVQRIVQKIFQEVFQNIYKINMSKGCPKGHSKDCPKKWSNRLSQKIIHAKYQMQKITQIIAQKIIILESIYRIFANSFHGNNFFLI